VRTPSRRAPYRSGLAGTVRDRPETRQRPLSERDPAGKGRSTGLVLSDHVCENSPVAPHPGSDWVSGPRRGVGND